MQAFINMTGVVMALALLANTASAVNIAKDSFLTGADPSAGEYLNNVPFDGPSGPDQNPTVAGFTGAWNNGGTGLWRSIDVGLEHAAISGEAGGSALFQFDTEVGVRNVRRNLTSPPVIATGGEFWVAGLVQLVENDPNFNGFAYAGFASDLADSDTQGLRFGVVGDGSEMDLVVRHRINTNTQQNAVLADGISAGDTHLVLMQVMVNSDLGGGGVPGNDNVNVWLNPADVTSVAALGAPTLSFEDFSLFNNNGFNFLTLEGSDITGGGVRFDELALGTSLAGVVAANVPEPTTALLGLMGLGGMLARRRRMAA